MFVTIVEDNTLFCVFAREDELAATEEDRPSGMMGLQEKLVVLLPLG